MTADQALAGIFDDSRALVEDPAYPAVRRWREAHPDGHVVGHFQVYFPEEIAHAAGMLPVKILGGGSAVQIRKADARIAAFVCSILRSSLELGLNGQLDFLSLYVMPTICDTSPARLRRVGTERAGAPMPGALFPTERRLSARGPLPGRRVLERVADVIGEYARGVRSRTITCAATSPCSTRTGVCCESCTA